MHILTVGFEGYKQRKLKITHLISKLLECDTCYYRNRASNYSFLIQLINLNGKRIVKLESDV